MTNQQLLDKIAALEMRVTDLETKTQGVAFGTVTVDSKGLVQRFEEILKNYGLAPRFGEPFPAGAGVQLAVEEGR